MSRVNSMAALDWAPDPAEAAGTWGWAWLNKRLGPPRPGALLVVGARDGVGKSFLLLHVLHEVARAGHPALYISAEDVRDEVYPRLQTGLAHRNLDVEFITGGSLRAVLDAMAASPGAVVGVDYLQVLKDDTGGLGNYFSKADQVAGTLQKLKAQAAVVGVPLIVASQVGKPAPDEDQHVVPSRYRLQDAPAAINNMASAVVMMGPERDGAHVALEVQKAKGMPTGGRMRLRRGHGGRLERATVITLDEDDGA